MDESKTGSTIKAERPPRDQEVWHQDWPEAPEFAVDEALNFESEPPRQLIALWQGKRADDGLPARGDFDWAELQPFFGWICIAEVAPARDDLRYRLIGSGIVEMVGRDVTGRLVSEVMPAETLAIFRDLIASPRILRTHGAMQWRDKEFIRHESLLLPLADNGADVDQFLILMTFMT